MRKLGNFLKKFLLWLVVITSFWAGIGYLLPSDEPAPPKEATRSYQELLAIELATANELLPPYDYDVQQTSDYSLPTNGGYGWKYQNHEWVWGKLPDKP